MKRFIFSMVLLALTIGCTDDVIRQEQTDFFFRPATEAEALTAGCSNPATAQTMVSFIDSNNNGQMEEFEASTAVVRQTLCGGTDGQDGSDGYSVLVSMSSSTSCDGTFVAFYQDINFNRTVDDGDNYLGGYNACNGIDGIDAFSLVSDIRVEGTCTVVDLYLDMDRSGTVSELDIPQSSFTVCNGSNGSNGQDGEDAPYLLVEAFQIAPLEQELIFYLDLDGSFSYSEGDTVVERIVVRDGEQGVQGIQGPQGERGEAGADGTNGVDGTDGLDGVSPPALSVETEYIAGVTHYIFYYDLNDNGTFDGDDSVASTGSIADGEDGATGATGDTGAPGADGADGYNWLFTTADVAADPYCSADQEVFVDYAGSDSATRITFIKWIDTGNGIKAKWRVRNGQEVAVTNVVLQVGGNTPFYAINSIPANTEVFFLTDAGYNGVSVHWNGGSKGTASSGSKPSEADAACEGGLFLFGGLDVDRNGSLDEAEVTLSQLIPAGKDGEDGEDLIGATTEYVDPLPGVPSVMGGHKELVLKVTDVNGDVRYFGVYYDKGKKRTFLSELFPGKTYATTDGRKGTFKVDNL